MRLSPILGAAMLLSAMACSSYGSSSMTGPPPPANTVRATTSNTFTPQNLTVRAGQTVTFQFGSVAHNVFFDAMTGAPTDIAGENTNVSVDRVFDTAGTYHYTCHIHPGMSGNIVVQ